MFKCTLKCSLAPTTNCIHLCFLIPHGTLSYRPLLGPKGLHRCRLVDPLEVTIQEEHGGANHATPFATTFQRETKASMKPIEVIMSFISPYSLSTDVPTYPNARRPLLTDCCPEKYSTKWFPTVRRPSCSMLATMASTGRNFCHSALKLLPMRPRETT